jgi:hypothetical protein
MRVLVLVISDDSHPV